MSRVTMWGYELQAQDPQCSISGAVTQVATANSGTYGGQHSSGVSNLSAYTNYSTSLTGATTYFFRAYLNFADLPTAATEVMRVCGNIGGAQGATVKVTSGGALQLFNAATGTQIGSDSAALSLNTWYRVEVRVFLDSGLVINDMELKLDGSTVANTTGLTAASTSNFYVGWITTPGASKIVYVDDCAINNDLGVSNLSWPGAGSVRLAYPTSDSQIGSWTGGAGGTTNLYDAVNTIPPGGTATETNLTQIESIDASGDNATDEYRGSMQSYVTLGYVTGSTIIAVMAMCNHGEDVSTGTKSGSFGIQSNPADSYTGFTYGNNGGALGTYPTGWVWTICIPIDQPSIVTPSNPIIIAVRKTDTGTRVASVDWLGAYVEIAPPAGGGTTFPQALTATTLTATATMQRQTNKLMVATTLVLTATLIKSVLKKMTATSTVTATLQALKVIVKALTVTVTTSASIVKKVNKPLSATVTLTATLQALKVVLKALTATVTTSASIIKKALKNLTTTTTTSASMQRQVNKVLSVTVTLTATLQALKVILKTLTATVLVGTGGRNEIRRMRLTDDGPTPLGGTFTLTFKGQTTGTLAYNDSVSTVQTALDALSNLVPGECDVSDNGTVAPETIDYLFEFKQQYGNQDLVTGDFVVNSAGLTGDFSLSSSTTQQGQPLLAFMQRQVNKLVTAGAVTASASLSRQVNKVLSVTSSIAPSIRRQISKSLAVSVTITASLLALKVVLKALTATVTVSASLIKSVLKPLTATTTALSGTMQRQTNKVLSATATTTASLLSLKVFLKALTATVTTSASITRSVLKPLTATLTTSASMVRSVLKTLTANVSVTASLTYLRAILKTLTATVTTSATITTLRTLVKTLSATVTTSAAMTRLTSKILSATSAVTGVLAMRFTFQRLLVATVTTSAVIQKRINKFLQATASSTATIARLFIPASITYPVTMTATIAVSATLSAVFQVFVPFVRHGAKMSLQRFGFYN